MSDSLKKYLNNIEGYYEVTRDRPPRPHVVQAADHARAAGFDKALDLGCGGMADTRYLLAQGFDVTAVDREEAAEIEAQRLPQDRFHFVRAGLQDFEFVPDSFGLVLAMYALPFVPPGQFDQVFAKLRGALVSGGVFCGEFFGVRDEWNKPDASHMTFHAREDVDRLLAGMEVLCLEEQDGPSKTADGTPKYWHVYHIIAKKRD